MEKFLSRLDADWLMTGDGSCAAFKLFLDETAKKYPALVGSNRYHFVSNFASVADELDRFQVCAVFEEFPFKKDSTARILSEWNETGKPSLLVFMDQSRRSASTDIDRSGDDLIQAREECRRSAQAHCVVKSAEDVPEVLCRHFSFCDRVLHGLKGELNFLRDDLDFLFDGRFEDFLEDCRHRKGCLTEASRAEICSLQSVKKNFASKYLWQCYNAAALQKLFERDGAIDGWLKLYDEFMKPWLSGGERLKSEHVQLRNALTARFNECMMPQRSQFRGTISAREISSEIEYTRATEARQGKFYGIKPAYLSRFREFVEVDARAVLKNFLEREYKTLEQKLNGGTH